MSRDETVDMSCPELELLAAFVEGNVSSDERSAIESHLKQCPRCFDIVASVVESMIIVPDPSDFDPA